MIGVFGGSFDPIHYGHLRIALDVFEAIGLHQIRFVPLQQAVHRGPPAAPADTRLRMVEAAVADQSCFLADAREIRRTGPSYTVDTLSSLRDDFPDLPLCLLLGGDAFNGFHQWREPERILGLAHLVVMRRPGYRIADEPALQALLADRVCQDGSALRAAPNGRILLQDVTQLAISSSDIRARISAHACARFLTPDPVLEIIDRESLYRT